MHSSIKLNQPVEFINITPVNPLISKCQIKVCYVGDKPNRNRSIITKDTAREMANSLPGSPIVGFFNEVKGDFEEHNRIIDVSNGRFEIKDTTRPYGFVDLNPKVWFQKFLDDGKEEHEYLMTEGWLWTSQYPECQRVMTKGNNQSMELDENSLNATWSRDENGDAKFFIINEAIISKLCILGEDCEPCFEGANITEPTIQFSFEDGFKEQLFSMMKELKEYLQEGGAKVFTRYSVTVGDTLWNALYSYVEQTYPNATDEFNSVYRIDSICEEDGQKFAVLQHRSDEKYYRLNFSMSEANEFTASDTLIEVTSSYTVSEDPQFALIDIEAFESTYKKKADKDSEEDDKKSDEEDKTEKEDNSDSDNKSEGSEEDKAEDTEDDDEKKKKDKEKKFAKEDTCPKCGKPLSECTCEEDDKKKKDYSLDEIPEYVDLKTKYSELETNFAALKAEKEALEAQIQPLTEFKAAAERKDKEAMIDSFYMLSDEDKADVVSNIDTYSLDDIEAKLSIICVRNKVNFDLDEDKEKGSTTFNLESGEDDSMPAWVKRAMSVAKTLN